MIQAVNDDQTSLTACVCAQSVDKPLDDLEEMIRALGNPCIDKLESRQDRAFELLCGNADLVALLLGERAELFQQVIWHA